MTNIKREQIVVASFLDDPHGKPGPAMCSAIANVELWNSVEASFLASCIALCLKKGWRTTRKNVARLAGTYSDWLNHSVFTDGLPLSCAEDVARELLPHYRDKRLVHAVATCYEAMKEKPEAAWMAAMELRKTLEKEMV